MGVRPSGFHHYFQGWPASEAWANGTTVNVETNKSIAQEFPPVAPCCRRNLRLPKQIVFHDGVDRAEAVTPADFFPFGVSPAII